MRVASLIPMRDYLHRNGSGLDRALRTLDLPASIFDHPEMLVPHRVVMNLFERTARLEGIETLGAHIGHAIPLEALGIYGRRIAAAATLGDALANAARLAPRYFSGETFWLLRTADQVRLHHRFPIKFDDWYQQTEQFSLCCALRLVRSVVAPPWRPTVHLKRGMPRAIVELPLLRDSDVVFDQATWAIGFPRSLLRRPLPPSIMPPPTAAELESWSQSAPANDFALQVAQVIGTALLGGRDDIDVVATWIGTSVRTLQRRLLQEQINYAQLLAKTRLDVATRLLSDDAIPVQDIALSLGYSDPAHFTRAFRRWTGSAPRTIRQLRPRQLEFTAKASA